MKFKSCWVIFLKFLPAYRQTFRRLSPLFMLQIFSTFGENKFFKEYLSSLNVWKIRIQIDIHTLIMVGINGYPNKRLRIPLQSIR